MKLLTAIALITTGFSTVGLTRIRAQEDKPPPPIIGRWDLTLTDGNEQYPSWLEVTPSGYKTLVGRFVGRFGSARPVSEVEWNNGKFHFSIPVQWEQRKTPLTFDGTCENGRVSGTTTNDKGGRVTFTGVPCPDLIRRNVTRWGQPIELFNGRDFTGWHARHGNKHGWQVENGILINKKPGTDLVSEQRFKDFRLHIEFRYPKGSNSGIYLRGRYEAQIEDNYGRPPDKEGIGGIYGFLKPRVNSCRLPNEWQTYDITLIGRIVSVTLNGEAVIERQEIPGITGGALDSDEGSPGPLMVQGDHGQVEFRKITITPSR